MNFTKRKLLEMSLCLLFTFGLYAIYWIYSTKEELNEQGAQIPTFFFFFIPFVNFYFLYKFAEAFCDEVLKDTSQTIAYFLLTVFLSPIAQLIMQHQINEKA